MTAPEPNDTAPDRAVPNPAVLSEADHAALVAAKRTLRAAVRVRRRSRAPQRRAAADSARTARLIAFLADRVETGLTVAAYLSTDTEPGTLEFIAWCAAHDLPVLLPLTSTDTPDWAGYSGPDDLRLGRHGIGEPTGPALGPDTIAAVDLVVMPGLAGNEQGQRLGQGSGWYDRALAGVDGPVRVLLLNDDEVLPAIPAEPTDQPVDVIITELRTLVCTPAG